MGGSGAAIDVPPARLSAGGTWHVLVQAYAAEAAEVQVRPGAAPFMIST